MKFSIDISRIYSYLSNFLDKNILYILIALLSSISIFTYLVYLSNGLGLSYNDARSHLDIGRRVVEGLKPGLAQLGSVWLPLPHLLMVPSIWNDFMWHSGLAGSIQSMISYVVTGVLIYSLLKFLKASLLARVVGVLIFALNPNILYLQSTAMTELLLLSTMTAGVYKMILWHKTDKYQDLIIGGFFIMLSTLVRYDGWFLLFLASILVFVRILFIKGWSAAEGTTIMFLTLSGFGIFLWLLWNLAIFKDPLYFAFGPYSAHSQQEQLETAGVLATKGDLFLSIKIYFYALAYNSIAFLMFFGFIGSIILFFDKSIKGSIRYASLLLYAPLVFNIIALFLGHSVLFIQGLSGDTWFNVRYGVMMVPSFAIFIGYLISRLNKIKYVTSGLVVFVMFFSIANSDAVTIDDARVGSSQKNVSEVSGWLAENVKDEKGFVLISAASHDAIIFSSGLPMKRFIHEGTGRYWESATASPDRWAKWIVMRTNDLNDQTFRLVKESGALGKYNLVDSYPFADIYEIKPQFLNQVNTEPVFLRQK